MCVVGDMTSARYPVKTMDELGAMIDAPGRSTAFRKLLVNMKLEKRESGHLRSSRLSLWSGWRSAALQG